MYGILLLAWMLCAYCIVSIKLMEIVPPLMGGWITLLSVCTMGWVIWKVTGGPDRGDFN